MVDKPKVIALMGPTASGKTALAIGLHKAIGAEIVSVDSALVYRGLDIGTAKPTPEELTAGPHRLIDIRDPADVYSVANFVQDASAEIELILAEGKTPLLVGGTMLYFKALLEGLSPMPAADPEVRAGIEALAKSDGWESVHAELTRVDPLAAKRIHPNHSQRVSRALEVYRLSGKTMTEWQSTAGLGLLGKYDWLQLAVIPQNRSVLHQRIALRFDKMLSMGFIKEVEYLFARGDLHSDLPAIRAVGYRQAWEYLEGITDYDTMKEKGIIATRQLAKRQLTWLRGWSDLHRINTLDAGGLQLGSNEILAKALNIINGEAI